MDNKKKGIILTVFIIALLVIAMLASNNISSEGNYIPPVNDIDEMLNRAETEAKNVKPEEMKEFETVKAKEFETMYNGEEPKVVLYGSTYCHFCQIAEPIIKNIAFEKDLTIYYLNGAEFTSKDEQILSNLKDHILEFGTPTLMLVQNGEIKDQINGLVDKKAYLEFFEKNKLLK